MEKALEYSACFNATNAIKMGMPVFCICPYCEKISKEVELHFLRNSIEFTHIHAVLCGGHKLKYSGDIR